MLIYGLPIIMITLRVDIAISILFLHLTFGLKNMCIGFDLHSTIVDCSAYS